MQRRILTAVLTVALLGWAGAVQADPVIYDNGAANNGYGSPSFLPLNVQYAEDFVLPTSDLGWRVTDVHWDGFEFENLSTVDSFRIIFYADDGGMPTGSGLPDATTTALAVRDVTATVMDSPNSDIAGVHSYWADIDPVVLDGGTLYWVVIQAINPIEWFWSNDFVFDGPNSGNYAAGIGDDVDPFWGVFDDAEHVFSLTGHEVPAPGAAVLAMLGLPAIGWVKRRFG